MRPGPATHWLWVPAVWMWGRLRPHSARSCNRPWCTVGAASGRPGGSASCLGVEHPELGTLPRPTASPWGVRPALLTQWLLVRGGWQPVTNPTVLALASWLCALWGRQEGTLWGRLLPECVASGVGRSLTPERPSLGPAAGAPYPLAVGAGGVGVGTPLQRHSARSCELPWRPVGAAPGRPGGSASCLGVERPELDAPPRPTDRPWGVQPGPVIRWLLVRRVWGPVTNPTALALASWLCALWQSQEGTWEGGASYLGLGRLGLGAFSRPTARPWGVRPGPASHLLWVRCASLGARLSLAVVLCCVRFPSMRHRVAFVAWYLSVLKPVRTPVAILGSLGVCIYVPASRHWLISYSPIHLT